MKIQIINNFSFFETDLKLWILVEFIYVTFLTKYKKQALRNVFLGGQGSYVCMYFVLNQYFGSFINPKKIAWLENLIGLAVGYGGSAYRPELDTGQCLV